MRYFTEGYNNIRVHFIATVLSVVLMGTACLEDPSGNTTESDDLPIDTLEIVMEIGEEIGDSTNTFASISDVLIDHSNRIVVLDQIEACLKVYDIDGNFLMQVSRRGSGPGEFINPTGLFEMPDGRLGVIAMGKSGYITFDESFNFIEELNLWRGNSPYCVTPLSDSSVVACKYDFIFQDDNAVLRRTIGIYGWGESIWHTLLWKDSLVLTLDELQDNQSTIARYAFEERLSTSGNGDIGVFFAPMDSLEYRVLGWDERGNSILDISRDVSPILKTEDELDNESFYLTARLDIGSGGSSGVDYQPSPYRNQVTGVYIGPDENLWVRRGVETYPYFDVYDLTGNLTQHVVFPISGWSWQIDVSPNGILAWELDPVEGYQKLYLLK